MWHPNLSEIEAWFETKTKGFVEIENRNPNHDSEALLQSYIYTDIYEVFFATFPSELYRNVDQGLVQKCGCLLLPVSSMDYLYGLPVLVLS